MREYHVSREKQEGAYPTISAAIGAASEAGLSGDETVRIRIDAGTYREKVFTEIPRLILEGSGEDQTILTWSDGAFDPYTGEGEPENAKRGTFRSYTAFLGGSCVAVRNMTIRNEAGEGKDAGQALAVYADADVCLFERVTMTSCQDTLFCAPLPDKERQPRGFVGPRMNSERRPTRQYYVDCTILGDVDFIFGGADAVFDGCHIISHCRTRVQGETNGYITAPSGKRESLGMVFRACRITAEEGTPEGSVYLGRPWRPEGKSTFLHCQYDESISPRRFSGWKGVEEPEPEATFAEYAPVDLLGAPLSLAARHGNAQELTAEEAAVPEQAATALAEAVQRTVRMMQDG